MDISNTEGMVSVVSIYIFMLYMKFEIRTLALEW